ncbi:MAG: OmpW family outer membrane protein [Candidatus Euphemobacter frigidus]|nr:OmpW family outer membrane protein [Candidatus Euphemobacter frigidus]MDP8275210.1 OmpW family outer membrane protein [Candidatus Euphemobacter frigidus]
MRTLSSWLVILAVLCFPAVLSAQSIGFDLHGIYAFKFDGESGAFGQDRYEDVVGGGATFFFAFIPAVRVEFGADWIETKNKDLDNSRLKISPLTAALRLGYPVGRFYSYLGGGLGYTIYRLRTTGDADRDLARRGIYDLNVANDLSYFAMAGVELVVSEHIGVRAEYRYCWMRTELKYDDWLGNDEEEDLNLDHQEIRCGLVVYF